LAILLFVSRIAEDPAKSLIHLLHDARFGMYAAILSNRRIPDIVLILAPLEISQVRVLPS
jgi:hypothetical protein